MNIRQIDPKDTYAIRHIMLREGLDVESCKFDGDFDELTIHLGGFVDEKLASVASFYFHKNENIDEEYQYQLRGMATLSQYQAQGLSSALLKTAFPMIRANNVHLLWCNARIGAIGFYEKVGFTKLSDQFDIPGVGPHVLMSINP